MLVSLDEACDICILYGCHWTAVFFLLAISLEFLSNFEACAAAIIVMMQAFNALFFSPAFLLMYACKAFASHATYLTADPCWLITVAVATTGSALAAF